jgi:hypothetical protein
LPALAEVIAIETLAEAAVLASRAMARVAGKTARLDEYVMARQVDNTQRFPA